ncbi:SH2 domain-containing protein 4B [Aphelenchoides bicaudatus]|nr:SH2 domain-containing protein 4B [Aphelenchoides bicaudatus]
MSALRDILEKMYVEDELLAQLDEEQKHILFIKMLQTFDKQSLQREEQLRRWRIREAELEAKERSEPPTPKSSRRIQWLLGKDGEIWTWVMGDYPGDKSIDDIIENEARKKARALVEAELMREKMDNGVAETSDTDEEHLKQQLRQMRLGTSSEESNESSSRSSRLNDQPQPMEIYNPKSTTNFINQVPYYAQMPADTKYDGSDGSSFESNGQNSFDEVETNNEVSKKPLIQKLFGKNHPFNDGRNQQNNIKSSPLPWRANKRSESPAKSLQNNSQPAYNSARPIEQNGNHTNTQPLNNDRLDSNAHVVKSYNSNSTKQSNNLNGNSNGNENDQRKLNNVIRPPPPVPARPAHLAKKPKDKGFVQRDGPSPFPVNEDNNGSANVNLRESARLRHANNNRLDDLIPQDEIEKRQSKMLEMLMDEHHRLKEQAEKEAESERLAYEERERKAREAEAQIKFIAQRARQQHENTLRTSSALLPVLNNTNSTSFRDAVKNIARPPKPQNRGAIIRWYKQTELPIGTGLDSATGEPAHWFHGILTRQEADSLLANQPCGAFIVRISERIFGYTISYAVGDEGGSSKHFLVEKIQEGYQFLGTNQIVHDSLAALVEYHEEKPITSKGRELLLYPIGQLNASVPDYLDLFDSQAKANAFTGAYRHVREDTGR